MTNLNYLDNFFFQNYFNRNGFWYAFKRSVNDIDNLQLLLRYLQVYHNRNWLKNQKEYSDILINEKILILDLQKIRQQIQEVLRRYLNFLDFVMSMKMKNCK